jgi:hypothetical protein
MPFTTLTDAQEKEFWRLFRLYWKEARKCEEADAHLAGCIIVGSCVETILVLMVNAHADEAEKTGKAPTKHKKIKPLLDWVLADLLDVAVSADWLPANKIGRYMDFVRGVRNLIHPSRYCQGHFRRRITAAYLQRQFELALACRDWLVHHNNEVLIENMKQEGIW